jgi:hypothetical protein
MLTGIHGKHQFAANLWGVSQTTIYSIKKCRGAERAVLLKILRYLNEVERRRLYVPRGYASLYDFCTDYLGYSRSAAMRRIHATRCIERFPHVAELLRSGELTLTAAAMISRILTRENADEIIPYARGKSTRDVGMLVSRHRPDFMLRDRVRPICIMAPDVIENDSCRISGAGKNLNQPVDNKADKNRGMSQGPIGIESDARAPAGGPPVPGSGAGVDDATDSAGCTPSPERIERVLITQKFKLEFAVDPGFMEKLARIRSFLSTKHPEGLSLEAVFDITMSEFLERHSPEGRIQGRNARKRRGPIAENTSDRKREHHKENAVSERTGEVHRSTGRDPAKRSRHIPPAVRDEVFARDGGRCTFIGDDGRRCDSDWNLEIDHIVPFAKGGDNSPENLRLLCARHNRLAAERAYGKDHMDTYYGGT